MIQLQARAKQFTLVEMLVVISIIAILASLLLPSLQNAMSSSYLVKCASNCRQVSQMLNSYMSDNNGFQPKPYLTIVPSPRQRHLWYQALYPYIGLPIPTSGNTAADPVFMCDILPGQSGYYRSTGDYALCEYTGMNIYDNWVNPLNKAKTPGRTVQFFDSAIFQTWSWAGKEFYDCRLLGRFQTTLSEDVRGADWRHGANLFGPAYYGNLSKGYDGRCNFAFLDGHVESLNNNLTQEEAVQMHKLY